MEHDSRKIPMGVLFSVIHRSFRRQIDALLSSYNVTGPQLSVLAQISHLESRGNEVNQRDIENAAHMSHATVTGILKRLESKGFIESSQSVRDKRSKCIHTTEKASALHEKIDILDAQVYERLFQGLTDEQRETMEPILAVMLKNAIEMKGSMEEE